LLFFTRIWLADWLAGWLDTLPDIFRGIGRGKTLWKTPNVQIERSGPKVNDRIKNDSLKRLICKGFEVEMRKLYRPSAVQTIGIVQGQF